MRIALFACASLTCVALCAGSLLYAQVHAAPEPPPLGMQLRAQDQLSNDELKSANPCPRFRIDFGKQWDKWHRSASTVLCLERVRSGAVALAWSQGRDEFGMPLDAGAPERKLAEMESWLRGLLGKYRIKGAYSNSGGTNPVSGTADCSGIGDGPGVTCVISAAWTAPKETYKDKNLDRSLESVLQSLTLLFGVDPVTSHVRVTVVDFRAVRMDGFLDDGSVMLRRKSESEILTLNPLVAYTWASGRVAAGTRGKLDMKFLVYQADVVSLLMHPVMFDLQLHRESSPLADSSFATGAKEDGELPEITSVDGEWEADGTVASRDMQDVESGTADDITPDDQVIAAGASDLKQQRNTPPVMDTLEEVSVSGEPERQRRVQYRGPPMRPDVITVARKGTTRVRLQPYVSRDTIRFRRESAARRAPARMSPHLRLQRDLLTSVEGRKIRDATLDLAADVEGPDGLPAVIPFGQRTSLVNIDHVRLSDSGGSTLTKVTNAINPQSRQCTGTLTLADNGDEFRNRFVLLGDRLKDCEATVRERQGDLIFASDVPQRLREELSEIYDPVYSRFAGLLGSEPGMVFVAWRPESPRADFRFERNWSRSILLLFQGSAWQQGLAPQQRKALQGEFAVEQIARRLGWQEMRNEFTQSGMSYLLMLNEFRDEHDTVRMLTTELPDWIGKCARDLKNPGRPMTPDGDVASYDCGLALHFVYDAVARATSQGRDTIYTTWRELLTASYHLGKSGVEPGTFLASSGESRRLVQGLLDGSMDWSRFATELDRFGVRLRVKTDHSAPAAEVESLVHFRD